jgi:hypothetical protein
MLHSNIIRIRDENMSGQVFNELELEFNSINISIRDIITERVFREVTKYKAKAKGYKNYLVQPKEEELELNGEWSNPAKAINAEKQVEVALQAFQNNGFFILIDDHQAESLDEIVSINSNPIISFIKLTPLVGG